MPSPVVVLYEVYRQPHSRDEVVRKQVTVSSNRWYSSYSIERNNQHIAATYLTPILLNEKQASLSGHLVYKAMDTMCKTTCGEWICTFQ